MPDKDALFAGIDGVKDRFDVGSSFSAEKAVAFLDEHPEVYVDRNYGELISAIYAYKNDGRVKDVFDAVTKAMFTRHLASKDRRGSERGRLERVDRLYFSPRVWVRYGMLDGLNFRNENLVSSSNFLPPPNGAAFRFLPTSDMNGVTVKLDIYWEESMEPLP